MVALRLSLSSLPNGTCCHLLSDYTLIIYRAYLAAMNAHELSTISNQIGFEQQAKHNGRRQARHSNSMDFVFRNL
jgi:hypothetical protein